MAAEKLKKQVLENLKTLISESGMTRAELRKRAKLNERYVSTILNRPSNLTLETLDALAAALGCNVTEIIDGKSAKTKAKPGIKMAIELLQKKYKSL